MNYEIGKLHQGLSYEQYSSFSKGQAALRSSHLQYFRKSPRHLRAALDMGEKESTDAMAFGTLVHSVFENPAKFMDLHLVEPIFEAPTLDGKMSTRSKAAKEAKEAWYANLRPDAIVVTQDQAARIYGILETLKEKKLISKMIQGSVREQSLWVKDPETGVTLAIRPDLITSMAHACDLKTCRDASWNFFQKQIFEYRSLYYPFYLLNASHYAHCLKLAGISDGKHFIFIAIESTQPFEMRVYPLDEGALDAGNEWRRKYTREYAECLMSGKWPGFPDEAFPVTLPDWFDGPANIGDPLEEELT